jgi:uncharacterized protein (TIGR02246 family)
MASAQQPEELDTLLYAAMAAGDVEALAALYEENAIFANAGEVRMQGADALRAGLGPFAATLPRMAGEPLVVANFGDIAVIYNDWTETGVASDGQPFERNGKAIEVVRRQPDGSWKFLYDDPYGRG